MEMQDRATTGGPLAASEVLSEQEARDVEAALVREGYSRKSVAETFDLNYRNVRKILNRHEPCWPKYADVFNELLIQSGLTDE